MYIFHNRPLALACCVFALTAAIASKLSLESVVALGIACGVGCLLLFLIWFKRRKKQIFLSFLCCLFASVALASSFLFFHVHYAKYQSFVDRECIIEGTVLKRTSSASHASSFYVQMDSLNGEQVFADVKLECDYVSSLQPGDRFCATTTGRAFETDGSFDEAVYSLSDGIVLALVCSGSENCRIEEEKGSSLRVLFANWNDELSFMIRDSVGGEAGNLVSALLLGNRSAISGDTELQFRRAGVSHLLALSGMHVSILIGLADWLLKKLRCPRWIRAVLMMVFALGYLMLTGCSPSTGRAVLMLCILSLGFCLKSQYDSFTSLCTVLFAILLVTPYAVLDVGMWMSFGAAGGIIVLIPALNTQLESSLQKHRVSGLKATLFKSVAVAVSVGLVANLALAYVQATLFGNISLMSIPTTLLLSLPMTFALYSGIFTLIFPPAAMLCYWSAEGMLWIAKTLSEPQNILLPLNDGYSQAIIGLMTLSLIFLAVAKLRRAFWGVLPIGLSVLALAVSLCVTHLPNSGVSAEYIPESGGDILLFYEKSEAVAVDFSDGSASGAYALSEALEATLCTELDDLILCHYHDRSAYFLSVLSSEVKIRNLRLPAPLDERERAIAERLNAEAELHGICVRYDTDELALQSLAVQKWEHTAKTSSRHEALLFSATADGATLTYFNAAFPNSNLTLSAVNTLKETDFLIVGATGFSTSSKTRIPALSADTELLVLTDAKLTSLLPVPYPASEVCYADGNLLIPMK